MTQTFPPTPPARVLVVGAGRLGTVLARALAEASVVALGPVGRDDALPQADIALLAVPDAQIAHAARRARMHAPLVGHLSGATPLTDVDFGLHPLQTFTGNEAPDVFHGLGVAVSACTPHSLAIAIGLARTLGAEPFEIDDAHRAEYHAAASFASNFVLTVLDAAERLGRDAGLDRVHLAPLVRRTVENWVAEGAAPALTGPIARGDTATVERQRAAASAAGLGSLFDALVDATRELAAASRDLSDEAPDVAAATPDLAVTTATPHSKGRA